MDFSTSLGFGLHPSHGLVFGYRPRPSPSPSPDPGPGCGPSSSPSPKDYDYKFISEPDDALKCMICFSVAKDPWQHGKCGRLFCKKCIDKNGEHKPCPNCRMKQPQYFEDNRSMRDIRALPVKCDNVERGCEKEETLGTLEEHMAVCQFTPVPCPKQCKIVLLLRKDLEHHINNECPNRDFECEYCGEKGTYANITQIHSAVCDKKIVPCPNEDCTETMKCHMIEGHVENDCEYTEVSCKYANVGCEVKLKRKDMRAHEEDDKIHLHLALGAVVMLKDKNVQLQDTSLQLQEKLQDTNLQLQDTISRMEYGLNNISREERWMWKQEIILMTFKLTDYQHKVENDEEFKSPSFYTSPEGYHMSIKVYINGNGDGEGTHVSVFVYILEGRNDSKLKWPFIGKVKIELLNHLEDDSHHIERVSFEMEHNAQVGSSLGYSQFIPHSELSHNTSYNRDYLNDDTLYFRVSVKVPDHKPWLECTMK